MMKTYRDIFGNPLPKSHVASAARLVVQTGRPTELLLARRFSWGYGKAVRVMELLEDAGVVSAVDGPGRTAILKTEAAAVNAALRQLRKGKTSNVR